LNLLWDVKKMALENYAKIDSTTSRKKKEITKTEETKIHENAYAAENKTQNFRFCQREREKLKKRREHT